MIMAAPDYKARFLTLNLKLRLYHIELYEDKEKLPLPQMSVAGGVKDLVPLQAEGTFSWLAQKRITKDRKKQTGRADGNR